MAEAPERRLYAPQRAEHASLHGPTAPPVTRVFAAAGPGLYGTVITFQEMRIYRTVYKDIYVWTIGPRRRTGGKKAAHYRVHDYVTCGLTA